MVRDLKTLRWLVLVWLALAIPGARAEHTELRVLPEDLSLVGKEAIQHLIVERTQDGEYVDASARTFGPYIDFRTSSKSL